MEKTLFKKITVDSALDELLGSAAAGAGVVGASIAMKMASGKINPWLVTLLGLASGYGIRLAAKNETAKDVGTGILIAGTLDGSKKILNKFSGKNATVDLINQSIPQLSGVGEVFNTGFVPNNLRGEYQAAQVVRTPAALLRG